MKTQRRHELQTNILADYLGKQIQHVRPHTNSILIGVIAVLVVFVGYWYFLQQQRASAGKGWAAYFRAVGNRNVKQLEGVAEDYSGTLAGFWALQSTADIKLAKGSGEMFADRKEGRKSLEDAERDYARIEKEAARYPLLLERSRYGLAQVKEGFGELEKAQEYYQKVAKANPDSALGKAAKRRAEQLDDASLGNFYDWFQKTPPVPRRTSAPGQPEPKPSGDLDSLSDKPDLTSPSETLPKTTEAPASGDAKPAEQPQPKPDSPVKEAAPAEKSTPPAPESSSAAKPAATLEKPAEDKPAEPAATAEKPAEKEVK